MIGSTETIPADPGGGDWVVVAWMPRTDRRPGAALFGVLLADEGLVWSTDAERATTFLTRRRADDVVRVARDRGDVMPPARIILERADQAQGTARVSVTGALGEA